MALIFANSCCAICASKIDTQGDFFATSGVVFGPPHPLYQFCDAPIHWDCYGTWQHRAEFARGYFERDIEIEKSNPYWGMALQSERVAVTVDPAPPVAQVSVSLAETGSGVRVPLAEWAAWVSSQDTATRGFCSLVGQAVAEVWPSLRTALPNAATVVSKVDWAVKRDMLRASQERMLLSRQARLSGNSAHNEVCNLWAREGAVCPYCGNGQDIRFLDKSPQGRSYFICNSCARAFRPVMQRGGS